jgi:hypothetical protein
MEFPPDDVIAAFERQQVKQDKAPERSALRVWRAEQISLFQGA